MENIMKTLFIVSLLFFSMPLFAYRSYDWSDSEGGGWGTLIGFVVFLFIIVKIKEIFSSKKKE